MLAAAERCFFCGARERKGRERGGMNLLASLSTIAQETAARFADVASGGAEWLRAHFTPRVPEKDWALAHEFFAVRPVLLAAAEVLQLRLTFNWLCTQKSDWNEIRAAVFIIVDGGGTDWRARLRAYTAGILLLHFWQRFSGMRRPASEMADAFILLPPRVDGDKKRGAIESRKRDMLRLFHPDALARLTPADLEDPLLRYAREHAGFFIDTVQQRAADALRTLEEAPRAAVAMKRAHQDALRRELEAGTCSAPSGAVVEYGVVDESQWQSEEGKRALQQAYCGGINDAREQELVAVSSAVDPKQAKQGMAQLRRTVNGTEAPTYREALEEVGRWEQELVEKYAPPEEEGKMYCDCGEELSEEEAGVYKAERERGKSGEESHATQCRKAQQAAFREMAARARRTKEMIKHSLEGGSTTFSHGGAEFYALALTDPSQTENVMMEPSNGVPPPQMMSLRKTLSEKQWARTLIGRPPEKPHFAPRPIEERDEMSILKDEVHNMLV